MALTSFNMLEQIANHEIVSHAFRTDPASLKDEFNSGSDIRKTLSKMTDSDRQELQWALVQVYQVLANGPNREERRRMARASR
jgi:hypothetical protein